MISHSNKMTTEISVSHVNRKKYSQIFPITYSINDMESAMFWLRYTNNFEVKPTTTKKNIKKKIKFQITAQKNGIYINYRKQCKMWVFIK